MDPTPPDPNPSDPNPSDPVSKPSIPPRPALRPIPQRPKRDFAAEEEAGRRLTAAHIQFRRGLLSEAEASAQALLAERPGDAGAQELLGDIAETRGDWAGAIAAYQAAVAAEPGRNSAETKIGKAVLRQAEKQRQETMGVAYASADTSLVKRTGGERSNVMIIVGSAICPGLGQIVQGQIVKGAILVGIFVLGIIGLTLLHGAPGSYFTPAFWVVLIVLAGDWLYAVADVSATSSKS